MALKTSNLYGKIVISISAVRNVVTATASESYGVAWAKCGKVYAVNNRMMINARIILKFGVSIDAVIESVRSAIKYNVEHFSGMIVECVNIDVLGIQN